MIPVISNCPFLFLAKSTQNNRRPNPDRMLILEFGKFVVSPPPCNATPRRGLQSRRRDPASGPRKTLRPRQLPYLPCHPHYARLICRIEAGIHRSIQTDSNRSEQPAPLGAADPMLQRTRPMESRPMTMPSPFSILASTELAVSVRAVASPVCCSPASSSRALGQGSRPGPDHPPRIPRLPDHLPPLSPLRRHHDDAGLRRQRPSPRHLRRASPHAPPRRLLSPRIRTASSTPSSSNSPPAARSPAPSGASTTSASTSGRSATDSSCCASTISSPPSPRSPSCPPATPSTSTPSSTSTRTPASTPSTSPPTAICSPSRPRSASPSPSRQPASAAAGPLPPPPAHLARSLAAHPPDRPAAPRPGPPQLLLRGGRGPRANPSTSASSVCLRPPRPMPRSSPSTPALSRPAGTSSSRSPPKASSVSATAPTPA